ncbi:hypothetical protein [Microvirga tunisiensis]|uniref:Uncharacterized protein n=1 Tax=Microvirga tunisiensis TaxID=2108360 RepID=A0A5N7MW58_9HYPH|nr:hypothetical protein [Microvirga tunisiensis]MPR06180.1 hypothetical protein [Microvirga tunisiensis]MPR30709.1 hypothetical protein [Microvirga tunisiensis]
MEEVVRRVGRGWIQVTDGEGCRHLFPASSRVEVSDSDCLRNECIVSIGAKRILVSEPYERVVEALLEAELNPLGRR